MARILPDGWTALAETGIAERERETLSRLSRALPDLYTVYHGVHWTRLHAGTAVFGSIDFVVVNPAGDLLLIEQKNGLLQESAEGLRKHDGQGRRLLAVALADARDTLGSRLRTRPGCSTVAIDTVLYCPDFRVSEPRIAGLPPERIIDSTRASQLPELLCAILPAAESRPAAAQVHRFLQNLIELEPDVSALMGEAQTLVTRLSGGLARWAGRLEMTPFRLRVTGTAGSGKTQLALAEYSACLARGQLPLYVCFNRPLADHFARIAPPGGRVATFHQWCELRLRAHGLHWDRHAADAFTTLEHTAATLPVLASERHDTVIVDEGQDFAPAWADAVLAVVQAEGRCLWLEDPLQAVYARSPVSLPGWVGLRAPGNHRSPRRIVAMLNALLESAGEAMRIEAQAPMVGDPVIRLVYQQEEEQGARVREALRLCWSAGFRNQDIVLLSFHGREHSAVLGQRKLAGQTLRSFSGQYDLLGTPLYEEGELLAESLLRFKGQSAPAVILCDVDFSVLDAKAMRRLFVGATRARLKLVIVLSESAARAWPEAEDPFAPV